MRPRINKNLVGSSELDSPSAKIATHNRTFMSKSSLPEKKEIHYITFFGKEYIIGKDITLEEVRNANLTIKTKII